jgi:hypothetical protein
MATTLYAYAMGTDLDDIAPRIEARLDELVAARTWRAADVWVVNQRETEAEWDLGVNLTLPASPRKKSEWLEDAAAIAAAVAALKGETGRSFVFGIQQGKSPPKDAFVVDTEAPNLEGLRTALLAQVR